MKKSWLINGILLLVVAALGWFVHVKARRDEPVSFPLSILKADEVTQIRLERADRTTAVVEKKGGLWRLTAPFPARAEPFQVQRLLAILDARSGHRLPANDLRRFDLDPAQTRLTIDGQSFGFGAVSAVTREQYVLTEGAVYTVEPGYGSALPANAAQLVKKRLLADGEVPVRFELRNFTVAYGDGRWHLSPQPPELSQDDVNRWVDAWREAAALQVEPYAGKKPVDDIKLELRDGTKVSLGILQQDPEFVVARPDEGLQYYFPGETAMRLLSPPGGKRVSSEQ